jgi:membrane protein
MVHWVHKLDKVLPALDDAMLKLIPFVMTAMALVLAYRIVPARMVPMRHAVAGGLFAAILFEITKYLFVVYISKVPTYSLVYGTFAAVPIFLLWLFCCWMVVLVGAEITATFSYFRHMDAQRADESLRVAQARRILDALTKNTSLSAVPGLLFKDLRMCAPMPIDQAEDALEYLLRGGLVEMVSERGRKRFRLAATVDGDIDDDTLRELMGSA